MPLSFSLLYDALFATPETYRRLHPALPRRDLPRLPVAQQGVGREKDAGQLENRLFISGGSLAPRLRVLNGAIGQQLGAGRAVVVLQPANRTIPTVDPQYPQTILNAVDGSYDPLAGASIAEAADLLYDCALAGDFSAAEAADLTQALWDELESLAHSDEGLHMGGFAATPSRQWSQNAFAQDDLALSESHSSESIRSRLDRIRRSISRHCRFSGSGRSLAGIIQPGTVTVLCLPQNSSAWMAFALHELTDLQNRGDVEVLPVFLGIYLSDRFRHAVEGLPGGRCFCYQDLPALGWVWQAAIAASATGCLLRHIGTSAQVISSYFGKAQVAKVARTTSSGVSDCDSGGLMGIFGSTTLSSSRGCTVSYEWEPAIPENVIQYLDEDEGIFFYRNQSKPYRVNIRG